MGFGRDAETSTWFDTYCAAPLPRCRRLALRLVGRQRTSLLMPSAGPRLWLATPSGFWRAI
jgi:hypothetical protein